MRRNVLIVLEGWRIQDILCDDPDRDAWASFLSRTREDDGRTKGLVEIEL